MTTIIKGPTKTKITDPVGWCRYEEAIWEAERKFDKGEIGVTQVSDLVSSLRQLQLECAEGPDWVVETT